MIKISDSPQHLKMKKNTIFLVGADTGGHVVPVFALAQELEKDPALRVFVIGVGSEIEKKFYAKLKNSKYLKISAGKSQFGSTTAKIGAFLKSSAGLVKSKYLILKYRPSVIFLKGNYATLPMAFAARFLAKPVVAHESDAVLGRSNKVISSFAKKVFLSYPEEVYDGKIRNGECSGPILRPEFTSAKKKGDDDYKVFNFAKNLPTVLILGGSLGARTINKNIFGILEKSLSSCQIIHQTGSADFAIASEAKKTLDKKSQSRYFVSNFINDELYSALRIADLVVSRAGSGVFEIATCGKATILIPYPHAAADHQSKNARYFTKKSAVEVIDEKNLSPTVLYSAISKLLASENRRRSMAENLKKSVKLDGREIIVNYLKRFISKNG